MIVNGADELWNLMLVTSLNPTPLIVTTVPTGPLFGVSFVIENVTVNAFADVAVPFGVVTLKTPVVAASGTVTRICVDERTLNFAFAFPSLTSVVPSKFAPLIVTVLPVIPLVGENDVINGPVPAGWKAYAAPASAPWPVSAAGAPS